MIMTFSYTIILIVFYNDNDNIMLIHSTEIAISLISNVAQTLVSGAFTKINRNIMEKKSMQLAAVYD